MMAQINSTSPVGECIMDRLRKAYDVNLADSERLTAYAKKAGASELLIMAEADLSKWRIKLKEISKHE